MPYTFDRLGLLWWRVADGLADFRAARTCRRLMKRSKFTDDQILAIVKEREAGLLAANDFPARPESVSGQSVWRNSISSCALGS